MKRILVIGSSGAGKSTFARRLGEKTGLPVIHLDVLFWKPNWTETPDDEWEKTVENALEGDAWIMDGSFSRTLEMRLKACDAAVFLDFPRTTCVYRVLKRLVFYRNGGRPDMAAGCGEKFDWKFLKWVWNFPSRSKPKVVSLLERFENEKTIIRLESKREVEDFFANKLNQI